MNIFPDRSNLMLSGFCKYFLKKLSETSKKHKLKRLNPSPIRGTNSNFSKDYFKGCPLFSNRYLIQESLGLLGDFPGKSRLIPPPQFNPWVTWFRFGWFFSRYEWTRSTRTGYLLPKCLPSLEKNIIYKPQVLWSIKNHFCTQQHNLQSRA